MITLAALRDSALVIFVVGAVVAVVLGWVRDGSLGQALVQAPLSPFAGAPALVAVTLAVAQLVATYQRARQRYEMYWLKLATLRGILFDARAPLKVRERAALAIARMDRKTALATLREAVSHPPVKATEENVKRFGDVISKALLVAMGAVPSVAKRLDPDSDSEVPVSLAVSAARDALFQLERHQRERTANGYPTISLDVDAADAEAVVLALHMLDEHNTRRREGERRNEVDAELLTALDGELASSAGGRGLWRNE